MLTCTRDGVFAVVLHAQDLNLAAFMDHTEIIRSAGFKVLGKERAITRGDTRAIFDAQNTLLEVEFLILFPSEQSRIFATDFTGKIRI